MDSIQKKELEFRVQTDYSNITGLVIMKNGQFVYENYFNNCTSNSMLHVYSVTKSIISFLIGIALDKGYIANKDQKILDFFPKYNVKTKNSCFQELTLRHLLTMTTPYKYNFLAPYIKYFTSDDWVEFSLDLLGRKSKIGNFKYTPLIGPDILSGIIHKVSGITVVEFANKYLFSPLNITPKSNIVFETKEEQISFNKATNIDGWVSDSRGINSAGWGLTLKTRDMVKIGQLILNKGSYNSNNIVSSQWIKDCTTVHSKWKKHNLSYGLLWWIIDEKNGIYAAMGDGGNTIYINESKDIAVGISSLFTYRTKDRIKFIQRYIEKLL
ncbi:MAG: serine hydrolase [bacterium]|nr:serine hydrolase [bacterium]